MADGTGGTWTYLGHVLEHSDGSLTEHDRLRGLDRELRVGIFGRKRLGDWEQSFFLPPKEDFPHSDEEMVLFFPQLVAGWASSRARTRVRGFAFRHLRANGSVEYRFGVGSHPNDMARVDKDAWSLDRKENQ